jgi:MFS family permease
MRQGPWAGRYPAAATMVILALVPYLGASAALQPITPIIARELGMSLQALELTFGMANAGYAVGTVLAVQFAQHLPQRRMLLVYGTLLVIGSVLAASATNPAMFIVGHILQGLCTSLLLIAAVPPLVVGYPVARLRTTVVVLNICVFGAVALGPVLGGLEAQADGWRTLFWVMAGIAVAALVLSLLTFEDVPPHDPTAPKGPLPIVLAASGCIAAFYGSSQLLTHPFVSVWTLLPLAVGLVLIATLLVQQYVSARPLLIVRSLASTFPVAGVTVAMCAAGTSVSAIGLTMTALEGRFDPLDVGLLLLPEFAGAVLAAVVFGAVFRTRFLPYFVLVGMLFLSAGILAVGRVVPPTAALTMIGSGLVGVGVGASVVPALFIAGFSLPSGVVQRVFAVIELLRAVAAFMIAPILIHVAATVGGSPAAGTSIALWICFGVATGGALLGVYLYVLARVRPETPDLERWHNREEPAWTSPPLFAGIRGDSTERALVEDWTRRPAGRDGGPPRPRPTARTSSR